VKFKQSTMLAGICLSFFHCIAHAQSPVDTAEAYQQEHEQYEIEPGILHMLALYYVNTGAYARALPALEQALLTSPDDIELKEALQDLHDKLCKDRQFKLADEVGQVVKERDPESDIACEHSSISPEGTTESRFNVDVAYRFNYDDNVAYPEENFATGEADYSHVFLADVFYDRPFGSGWRFFAQGHFLQSLYHQFDQFNQTRLSAVAAIGKTGKKIGWRLPVEVTQDWLDGSTYRTSLVTRPGLLVQFSDDFFSHFYGRIQSDDYKNFPYVQEDRSGDVYGGGVKIVAQASDLIKLHSYLEYNRYNTDGEYWQRDEIVAFVSGKFELSRNWEAGLALRYQKDDYDNVRPTFAELQEDTSKEAYLNLAYKIPDKWTFRVQYSRINHESNIAIFDYNRNVYSFTVIWEF